MVSDLCTVTSTPCSDVDPHSASLSRLATSDPEFFQFLQENDQQLLSFTGEDIEAVRGVESEASEDEDMGIVEQRPLHVTSRKEVCNC